MCVHARLCAWGCVCTGVCVCVCVCVHARGVFMTVCVGVYACTGVCITFLTVCTVTTLTLLTLLTLLTPHYVLLLRFFHSLQSTTQQLKYFPPWYVLFVGDMARACLCYGHMIWAHGIGMGIGIVLWGLGMPLGATWLSATHTTSLASLLLTTPLFHFPFYASHRTPSSTTTTTTTTTTTLRLTISFGPTSHPSLTISSSVTKVFSCDACAYSLLHMRRTGRGPCANISSLFHHPSPHRGYGYAHGRRGHTRSIDAKTPGQVRRQKHPA